MASNVIVIDSTFRRATVKVNPQTNLSDVLDQACAKLNLRPEQYGLKHNKKQLDLTLTWRLLGLPSGAQLELVQSSRSPAVVNVALQFPQSENNLRLTEKFPSSTSLWQILRRFESGVAGSTPYPLNLTQRGFTHTNEGSSGAGRLYYEMPSIQVMSREFGSFVDLQKTLAQIGLTSGSSLLRLSFKRTEQPLEEAMTEITQYFKASEEAQPSTAEAHGAHAAAAGQMQSVPFPEKAAEIDQVAGEANPPEPGEPMEEVVLTSNQEPTASDSKVPAQETSQSSADATGSTKRSIEVYSAPSSSAPVAATQPYNPNDYIPTVDHAKLHQSRLNSAGKNQRLPSDIEIEKQKQEKLSKLSQVEKVRVRIRLPDQTQVQDVFGREDTAADVFGFVRLVLRHPDQEFTLRYLDAKGKHVPLSSSSTQKLITGLGWTGDTLVYMTWGENVSPEIKKALALNEQYAGQATQLKVNVPTAEDPEKEKKGFSFGSMFGKDKDKGKATMSSHDREAKMKKLLGFGKK